MNAAEKWWREDGVYGLNRVASEYAGEGLGHIPLGHIFEIPRNIHVDKDLINLMRIDGADIGVDEEGDLYINIL